METRHFVDRASAATGCSLEAAVLGFGVLI